MGRLRPKAGNSMGEEEEPMTEQPRYFTDEKACSCPDWQYRGRERPCKHVRRLRAADDLIHSQRTYNRGVKHGNELRNST